MTPRHADIRYREGDSPGARYVSGKVVYDEVLDGGRLVARYWNPNGQIWPEMHLGSSRSRHRQPVDSFRLSVNGVDLGGGFAWQSAGLEPDPSAYPVTVRL